VRGTSCCVARAGVGHAAAINLNQKMSHCRIDRRFLPGLQTCRVKRFNSSRRVTAMTVDDFRSRVDAASSDVSSRADVAVEPPAVAAAVVPLRPFAPTTPDHHLSPESLHEIDRVFFGPFFRDKYGTGGDKALENSRIRYYGPIQPTNDAGELAGRRYVHEFDTMTGCTRGWHETLDRMGHVRLVRPVRQDGITRYYRFDSNGRYRGSW
jgi:hypothetical protein